jgi:hypothetical protein
MRARGWRWNVRDNVRFGASLSSALSVLRRRTWLIPSSETLPSHLRTANERPFAKLSTHVLELPAHREPTLEWARFSSLYNAPQTQADTEERPR